MAEGEFAKRSLLPRILERRSTPAVFQLGAAHRERGSELEAPDSPVNEVDMQGHRGGDTNTQATLNLRNLQRQPPKPLDEIATLVRGLIYGEMIKLSEAMWKNQPEGSAVTRGNLPALLHRWSTSHLAAAHKAAGGTPQ